MKVDCGFWNQQGKYIPDIQELNEIERKEVMETKDYDGFFEELNEMANFKNFGEAKEEPSTAQKIYNKLQDIFENDIYTYSVRAEDDNGYYMTEVTTLPEDSLLEVRRLIDDLMDAVEDNQ